MKKKLSLFCISLLPAASGFAQLEIKDATHEPTPQFEIKEYESGGTKQKVYVDHVALITSDDVEDAFAARAGTSTFEGKTEYTYGISITLTDEGAAKMKRVTESRLRRQLAFIVDGKVLSVPTVQSELSKNVMVTGFSKKEAEALAAKIISSRSDQRR